MAAKLGAAEKKAAGINPDVLKSLVAKCNRIKVDMDESRGELGAAVKDAEDAHGVHRKAFKLALTLEKMEDAPRADFLRALDDYREKLGFNDQADMFDEGGDEAARRESQEAKANGEDQTAENARRLKGGIKGTEQQPGMH